VRLEPDQLLADVAAIREQSGLLSQPLRLDGRRPQQFRQALLQAFVESRHGARANLHPADAWRMPRSVPEFPPPSRRPPLAKPVERVERFLERRHKRGFEVRSEIRGSLGPKHSGNAERYVEIGRSSELKLTLRLLESSQIRREQWPVQRGGGGQCVGLTPRDAELQVPARHPALDGTAHGNLESLHLRRKVQMHVQAPMVHGLDTEREFA
jgi:hypothetical protein